MLPVRIHLIISFFLLSCTILFSTENKSPLNSDATKLLSQTKHLAFHENKGQMKDQKGNATPFVLYKAEAPGLTIWVTTTGLTYQFIKATENEKEQKEGSQIPKAIGTKDDIAFSWNRVDMILKNAIIKKENCITEFNHEITQGKINYYLGNCQNGIFDVKSFSKITIKNIYEGIDWVLYTNNKTNSLKQDFIVHPNADPNQLKIIYEGNGKFEALNNQIHFENNLGELQEGKLFCYQGSETNEVVSNYIVKKNESITNLGAGNFLKYQVSSPPAGRAGTKYQDPTSNNQQLTTNNQQLTTSLFSYEVAIQLKDFDKSKELIIDPQLVWATFYGGASSFDGANGISCDNAGNIFITGYLGSGDFPTLDPGNGAYFQALHSGGNFDIFIMKFSNNGNHIWTTYYGGFNQDVAYSICNDNLNNVLITGYSKSTDFPVLNPGGTTFFQGTRADDDVIILKFDNNGVRLWATFYGATLKECGNSISTDANNNIYITGYTSSTNFPLLNQAGSFNQAIYGGGPYDAFILKFTNAGVRQWATYYGGGGNDVGHGITNDLNNNVLVTGETMSANFPNNNPGGAYFVNTNTGASDAFISKFNAAGSLTWGTYYGGTLDDFGYAIKTDRTGNIFVAGNTISANFPVLNPLNGAYFKGAITSTTSDDVFISKFSPAGTQLWSTYYGGTNEESFFIFSTRVHLALDNCDNIFVGFTTRSSNILTKTHCSFGYIDITLDSDADAFITQFSNGGVHMWASYLGGFGTDFRTSMVFDANNNLFITGEWTNWLNNINSATYPTPDPGGGAYHDATHNGDDDVCIWKFAPPTIGANGSATPSTCACIGTATATANGGCTPYQYLWYDSNWNLIGNTQTISNLCAGNYHAIVRDSMSCSNADTVNVTVTGPAAPDITMSPTSNLSCIANATGIIYASSTTPGATFSWSGPGIVSGNNNDTATVNAPGTYTVVVTNPSNGCTATATVIVTNNNNAPPITPGNAITLACNPTSGTIYASSTTPGVTYSWSGPGIVSGGNNDSAIVNTTGTYTITITDPNNGCTNTATVLVNANTNAPAISAGNPLTLNCIINSGNIYSTSSVNGATFSWSGPGVVSGNNNDTAFVNATGTYTVIVTDPNNGCTNSTTVIVNADTAAPAVTPGLPLTLTCIINSGTINANSSVTGATYNWSGPGIVSGGTTNTPTVNATGTYTVTITNPANGCTSTTTVNVNINNTPPAVTPGATLTVTSCINVNGNISASSTTPGATFSWSGPGIASGGNTANPTINALGTYTVTVTDPTTGCTNTATVLVNSSIASPTIATNPVIIPCNQTTGIINASSTITNATYAWSGPGIVSGGTTNSPTVNSFGTYTVIVTDPATGCTNSATATVAPPPSPIANVSSDITIALGTSTTLTASGGTTYIWYPSTNLNSTTGNSVIANPTQTITYCVEVTDNNGCKDTACVTVTVEIPCPTNENLQVPNAFSPNKDALNDEFCLQGWTTCIEEFTVIIFDRWGEKVYESKDPNFCWDGYFRNEIMDAQVFVYYIKARFTNIDKAVVKKGNISLLR